MFVSQLAPAHGYPRVQAFVEQLVDMQFNDVRAMLQLPRPDIGITPGCNFAIVSSLCNLISGVSVTIYKPPELSAKLCWKNKSGVAFRGLVRDFFPYTPSGYADFPGQLYHICRNPMAHCLGLMKSAKPVVFFKRNLHAPHADKGWTEQELEDLESRRFNVTSPGIVIDPQQWTVHCDSLYFDVIDLLRRLNVDTAQTQAAEDRFSQGVYNWGQ